MSIMLLCFLLWTNLLFIACTASSVPDALDLILGTKNFYQGHQPSGISWEYLTTAVLELINEELDQLEAISRNPSSLANSLFKLFEKRFKMFYPDYISLKRIGLRPGSGFRLLADVEGVFVKPLDVIKADSKICAVGGGDPVLAETDGVIVRVCKVGRRVDFGAPNGLAYVADFGDECCDADTAAIEKWINGRRQTRGSGQPSKEITTHIIPHLESYHPSVLDEIQKNEIYPMLVRLVEEATGIHLRLREDSFLKYPERDIRLLYFRYFFPGAIYVESDSVRGSTRGDKVVEWLGIKVGEHVVMNQVVAKCTGNNLIISLITGLVVKINMRVGEKVPSCTFSVIDPCRSSKGIHRNVPLLINAFHSKDLEHLISELINFTNIKDNLRVIARVRLTTQTQTQIQPLPKSPITLLLDLYSHQMKRMNTTLDRLQLEFISRLKLVKISISNNVFQDFGFNPYTVLDEAEENMLCKNCILVALNSSHCYAFLLDPSIVIQ